MGLEPVARGTQVSLLRWVRRQLRQREPLREHLEASIENSDPAEARRIVAQFAFSEQQRRHVDALLDQWDRDIHPAAQDLDPPGSA